MPKSRRDKKRKQKLRDYKTVKQIEKQIVKQMSTQESQQNGQSQLTAPPIRQVPQWKSNEPIDMLGIEFEAIFNYIASASAANAAVQAIMNRNILNGKVKVTFEKLSPDGEAYVPMSDDEQAPLKAEFDNLIAQIKQKAAEQESQSKQQAPVVQLVDSAGEPVQSEKPTKRTRKAKATE